MVRDMPKPKQNRLMRSLAQQEESEKAARSRVMPSPNPATNLIIADILVRGVSTLVRKSVEKKVAKASLEDEADAQNMLDSKTLLTTLGLYGASKLATRSPAGLGVVAGGLLIKTLYDRGKARQLRTAIKGALPKSTGEADS